MGNSSGKGRSDETDGGPSQASHISFDHRHLNKKHKGVVYIVTNNYHHSEKAAIRDHGMDYKNMGCVFNDDEYYVQSVQCATRYNFLATCNCIAAHKRYPSSCKTIIAECLSMRHIILRGR